jgi:type II secretory pathway predicted ATPase ExeA
MYERFFGLRERPFDLTANPKYLFMSSRHAEALSNLQYGITARRGVTLIIGEAGTGKTTLVRAFLESAPGLNTECIHLYNPSLTRPEFIEFMANAFGLSPRAARSKTALLQELEQALLERRRAGIMSALIVDEAQALPLELLEEVRLLANMETVDDKLLPVVLVGQPQLAVRLNEPDLKQLKQRVALRCDLRPLSLSETMSYITERVRIAGGDAAKLFSQDAVDVIHQCSQGIPRTISVICDNALMSGFATNQRPVGWEIVCEVCEDFDLKPLTQRPGRPTASQAPTPAPTPAPAPVAAAPARRQRDTSTSVPNAGGSTSQSEDLFAVFNRRRAFSFF